MEAIKSRIGLLKKVCRQRAVTLLKDMRIQMEESRAGRLSRAVEALRGDLAFVTGGLDHMGAVAAAADAYVARERARMAQEASEAAQRAERAAATAALRADIAEQGAANEARRARLAEAQARLAGLKVGARQEGGVGGWVGGVVWAVRCGLRKQLEMLGAEVVGRGLVR